MNDKRAFTLTEVLVAIAVLGVIVVFINSMTSAMRLNMSSASALNINQAAQAYLESIQHEWSRATTTSASKFGKLTSSSPTPHNVAHYTWTVDVCEVTVSTGSCVNAVTGTAASPPEYDAPSTAELMRLTITYTPTGSRGGPPLTATAEVARPETP